MEPTATRTPAPHGDATTLPVVTEYIGIRPGYCGGEPHILGHRIKVRHIAVWHDQMGMTPTEIAATYPTITLAQVHAALAYYYDHRDEIRAAIEDEHRYVEELKAKSPQSKLQQLLSARMPDAPDDEQVSERQETVLPSLFLPRNNEPTPISTPESWASWLVRLNRRKCHVEFLIVLDTSCVPVLSLATPDQKTFVEQLAAARGIP